MPSSTSRTSCTRNSRRRRSSAYSARDSSPRADASLSAKYIIARKTAIVEATGNGRLDAVSNALKKHFGIQFNLTGYEQHALSSGSFAQAVSYLGVEAEGKTYWGAGENSDITIASVQALVSALNNLLEAGV